MRDPRRIKQTLRGEAPVVRPAARRGMPVRWAALAAAVVVLCLAAVVAAPPAARAGDATGTTPPAPAFVEGFDDLPLMPALTQEPGRTVVFDSPYGRIVEAYAAGRVARDRVLEFYDSALPQLGWTRVGKASFRREGEVLTLDFTQEGPRVTVRFQVSPTG